MFLARSRGVRAAAALLSRPGTIVGARSYLEGESVYGFRVPRKLRLSPYKPDEIANRKENANLLRLVSAFRSYGHLEAELDPLGLQNKRNANELRLSEYGLENDGGKKFRTAGIIDFNDGAARTEATLDEIVHHLRATYCGRIAFEFEHLVTESERRWFAEMVESRAPPALTKDEHLRIHNLLARSEVRTIETANPSFTQLT